jgi:hypothetical protein
VTHALFRPFGFEGSNLKLCSVLTSDNFLVYGEIIGGEYHQGWIGALTMEVQVSISLMDFLDFAAAVCKWG